DSGGRDYKAFVFSPDETRLAVYSGDQSVSLRELGRDDKPLRFPNAQWPVFSPDGTLLATGNTSGDLQLWNCETGQLQSTFAKGGIPIAFSPGENSLISRFRDRVIVWDVASGLQQREI